MPHYNLVLVGCGKMGSALVRNWLDQDLIEKIQIVEPGEIDETYPQLPTVFHVKHLSSVDFQGVSLCVLATKPQIMDNVCTDLKPYVSENLPVMSIAAGKTTSYFQEQLGIDNVIRVMPNTPAAIGKGMSVLFAADNIDTTTKNMATELMGATGKVQWIDNEEMMDAVTAVSGSGPAYLFYFIESLAKAAEKQGFSAENAMQLARQTVIGSAALADQDASISASELRQNVTSPGGTTEAGLEILMDGRFEEILKETVEAATKRGRDLGNK